MQAVLYICHGCRNNLANQEGIRLIEQTMKQIPVPIQEYSFLELVEPSILKGIENCVKKGATNIAVIPVFLLSANHVKIDIPEMLIIAKRRYPLVQFTYGKPLGVHEKMVDVLRERISEQTSLTKESEILLVAHGSSDPEAIQQLGKSTNALKLKMEHFASIEVCYLSVGTPKFQTLLEMKLASSSNGIIVIPFLLFNGFLLSRIKKISQSTKKPLGQNIVITHHLADHMQMIELLKIRTLEALNTRKRIVENDFFHTTYR